MHVSLLKCVPAEEFVVFFDRLAFVRKCEQVVGSELTTRTNVLLVRQKLLTPGNGVVLTYNSQKNPKKNHHQGRSPCVFSTKTGGFLSGRQLIQLFVINGNCIALHSTSQCS